MNINNFEFYIKKYSHNISSDFSFLPKLMLRKLSDLDKAAISTLNYCYDEGSNPNLIFTSQYGQFDRLNILTNQLLSENCVSPLAFSASVHNNTISVFSLLKKITASYNSISAGKNSISSGLLDAVMQLNQSSSVLFCYADVIENFPQSISLLLSNSYSENSIKLRINIDGSNANEDEYSRLCDFCDNTITKFSSELYSLERV